MNERMNSNWFCGLRYLKTFYFSVEAEQKIPAKKRKAVDDDKGTVSSYLNYSLFCSNSNSFFLFGTVHTELQIVFV